MTNVKGFVRQIIEKVSITLSEYWREKINDDNLPH